MKTILVTGSNGLLGQKISASIIAHKRFNLIATSKGPNRFSPDGELIYAEMDVLDGNQLRQTIEQYRPDAIIHTAALTNVDGCESDQDLAYNLNVKPLVFLCALCEEYDIQLIHLSTDFVFDGLEGPYDEQGIPNPLSYYGKTKLEAEKIVRNSKCRWVILRTIIVFGVISDRNRSNIVLWAKNALESGQEIRVVNDQWRMPTLAEDLAECCLLAVENNVSGLYHVSGDEMMSISDLVYQVADFWNLDKQLIKEISSDVLSNSATRPKRTGFILDKVRKDLGYSPRSFREGLELVNSQL